MNTILLKSLVVSVSLGIAFSLFTVIFFPPEAALITSALIYFSHVFVPVLIGCVWLGYWLNTKNNVGS